MKNLKAVVSAVLLVGVVTTANAQVADEAWCKEKTEVSYYIAQARNKGIPREVYKQGFIAFADKYKSQLDLTKLPELLTLIDIVYAGHKSSEETAVETYKICMNGAF